MSSTESTQAYTKEQLGQPSIVGLYRYPIKSCAGETLGSAEIVETGTLHDRELMLIDPSTGRFISQRDQGGERLALVVPRFVSDDIVHVEAPGMPEILFEVIREGEVIDASINKLYGIHVVSQQPPINEWFSAYLGRECALVTIPTGYHRPINPQWAIRDTDHISLADGYNLLLTSNESLIDLQGRVGQPIPMQRFRPNIVVSGANVPYFEDRLRQIQIGNIIFDSAKPCLRCVITTVDQVSGLRGEALPEAIRSEPLATLSTYRYATVRNGDKGVVFGMTLINASIGCIKIGDQVQILELQAPPDFENR